MRNPACGVRPGEVRGLLVVPTAATLSPPRLSGGRTRGADPLPQASEEAAPLSGQRQDDPGGRPLLTDVRGGAL